MDASAGLRLLDVRDTTDFTGTGGHIPGAMNIPLPELKGRIGEPRSDEAIAVYCRTDRRSSQAIEYLRSQGFGKVLLVAGGMVEWGKRGLPVELTARLHR